jgi:hypothetical protein
MTWRFVFARAHLARSGAARAIGFGAKYDTFGAIFLKPALFYALFAQFNFFSHAHRF